jgi:hypothetical protein
MNAAWDNFETDFLNPNSWEQRKDGFPSDLLDALSPEEKAKAEEILFNRLDGSDDWPIRAMGHLRVARSVVRLRELLGSRMPTIRATAATAIYRVTGDADMEAIVADIAGDTSLEWMYRLDAVICLSEFQTDSAQKVLSTLESDPQYLIAYNAKRMRRN